MPLIQENRNSLGHTGCFVPESTRWSKTEEENGKKAERPHEYLSGRKCKLILWPHSWKDFKEKVPEIFVGILGGIGQQSNIPQILENAHDFMP